jgi:exo-beta-1,3-glucanase (GH17 family)/cellulose synthase/poly-beta-1,6-N-acetylglucosamine synthase-like glycosyltransferase
MKNAASLTLRLLLAAAIAAIVACAQYLIWQQSSHGTNYLGTRLSIKGFAYNGFQRDQSPLTNPPSFPTRDQIAADLELLSKSAERLRTYGVRDLPDLLSLAGEHDLMVTAGAWLDDDRDKNAIEIDGLIEASNTMRHIERVVVGNEVMVRKNLTAAQLIPYLDEVREKQRRPVSTAETWNNWLANPELADHVDYILVHLLPYHEGDRWDVSTPEKAVDYALMRYDQVQNAFPHKKIVIGEIGWPSNGPTIATAVASQDNQARFVRTFLAHPRTLTLDYFLMEAIDQPWKTEIEGWAGPYWGLFDADRHPKYDIAEGIVERDSRWTFKASYSALIALLPMFLVAFFLSSWSVFGRFFLAAMIQACVTTLVVGFDVPSTYYLLTQRDLIGLTVLIGATGLTAAVLLSHGFEFGEVLFKRQWRRRFMPLPPHAPDEQPFVSIHLACYNEPPDMVIATIDSLAALDYENFEVLILDNNTRDEALWRPLEQRCAELGPRFRFFHLMNWPGFKAGALNYGLKVTDPRAEVIGVVDADYVVDRAWIASLVPHFDQPGVAVVQAPQAHREWETQPFRRWCNWEFEGFFRIGMHHRNERNALIQHGTMTLVRRLALEEVGGWSEWCICEDTELGLRLIEKSYDTRYVDHILGRGLTPSDFAAIKSQRFRWAFGAMQILKAHLPQMLGRSQLNLAQRYHFLTGWFAWFSDALQLVFAYGSLLWTIGILFFPNSVSLPVVTLALPILGFMAFKAALGPILYRRTMACPWRDILGASILSVGLAHAIARGVFTGLVKKKGVFVVTPKGWKAKGTLAFFGPIREELGMLSALALAAIALACQHGVGAVEAKLWICILSLQCIPYLASIICQVAAYLPEAPVPAANDGELCPAS